MDSSLDITAIFVRASEHDPSSIRGVVVAGGYGDVWLRIRPLTDLGLVQVELCDEAGMPRIDPALVAGLAAGDRLAAFVHLNFEGKQGMIHAFAGAAEMVGWMGAPEELDARVVKALGHPLAAIVAADDGTRVHHSVAASGTMGLVRGRVIPAPVGLPLGFGSFSFHDRFAVAAPPGPHVEPGARAPSDRVALVAFDDARLRSAWATISGLELAARLRVVPDRLLGPLVGAREEAVADLAALGDSSPEAGALRSVRALELLLLSESCLYAGGDEVAYIDERLLPMFSLASSAPPLDDPEEAEELESRRSVLEAMVEVLPYQSPEGAMLEQFEDAELAPLPPWVRPGEESVGSIFLVEGERVRGLLGALDQRDLAARIDLFFRAWWKAQTDDPLDEGFDDWRRKMDERGSPDVHRFLTHWAEWRLVLELARANGLRTALLFYSL